MNLQVYANISKIIEQDSKATTYKFALLRGVIDIIQDNSPFIKISEERVHMPIGLMIEKWLLYYYPILESKTFIPQINGEVNLAFSKPFNELINAYKGNNGFSVFYNDLKSNGIPRNIQPLFLKLVKQLRDTITKMPMRYIGRSISSGYYSIFNYENKPLKRFSSIDLETLIYDFGTFSIPLDYYEGFKVLGTFISGQDSILFKWAEFSVTASGNNLSMHNVLNEVLISPITERYIKESKKLYKDILNKKGSVYCVWSGKKITNYDIDHVIPFSVWKNNDLWNLLPSSPKINNDKRDKIPSPDKIEKQKQLILDYWGIIQENQTQRFQKEIQVALLGNHSFEHWKQIGISQLQESCRYLIDNRGFQAWNS